MPAPGRSRADGRERRIALVTCSDLTDLDPDDRLVIEPLATAGVRVDAAVWTDDAVNWDAYDLAVIRSTWDYPDRREEFVRWAARVPRLANPADVVAWSTDKSYLGALAAAGVPVIETAWVGPADGWQPPASGEWVIKPAVGAGSKDAGRYRVADSTHRDLALAHVARLQRMGRPVMVQPYLSAVDSAGETALVYLGGTFSHAVRKAPMLDGPDAGVQGLYKPEKITAREPTPAELEVAAAALGAVPGGADRLLYARVDLIPGNDGRPVLVELELAEPSLFLGTAPGAAQRFAAAIVGRC